MEEEEEEDEEDEEEEVSKVNFLILCWFGLLLIIITNII